MSLSHAHISASSHNVETAMQELWRLGTCDGRLCHTKLLPRASLEDQRNCRQQMDVLRVQLINYVSAETAIIM